MSHRHTAWLAGNLGDLLKLTYTDSDGKQQRVVRGQTGLAALMVFADRANEYTGQAWPSTRSLARDLQVDRANLRPVMEGLVAGGLLVDTGEREGQATVYRVFPDQVTLRSTKTPTPPSGGPSTPTPSGSGGAGGGAGGGVGGGSTTPTHNDDDDDENTAAARVSAGKGRGKTRLSVVGTINPPTPNQAADMLDPLPGVVAGGENKKRLEKVTAAALELDHARHGALKLPAKQKQRERDLRTAAAAVLLDYPGANDGAVIEMALTQVHGTEPDPGLIEYLEDQQAAAAGWTDSGYCDPDTLPDWDHLHDDPVALDQETTAATRTGRTVEAAELTPEQKAATHSVMREVLDQFRGLKREAGQVQDQTPAHLAAALAHKVGNSIF